MRRCLHLYLCAFLFLITGAAAHAQESTDPWNDRARLLTDDLLSDTKALEAFERASLWGRLAEVWWQQDPERARVWLVNGIKLVESSSAGDKADQACRLVAVRTLLSIAAAKAPEFNERLTAILTKHVDRNDPDQARENATALVEAGLAVLASNPSEAGRLGAESLKLGLSFRLANLLWRLRNRDKTAGDALFNQVLAAAKTTNEYNLFSMLLTATVQGPYSTEQHQTTVLASLGEALYNVPTPQSVRAANCHLAPLLTSHLARFDKLLPLQAQRIRTAVAACSPGTSVTSNTASTQQPDGELSIEELLKSAERAESEEQKYYTMLKASDLAASKQKDFETAIRILDSISVDGQKRLGDQWESRRWNHAASAACAFLKGDDLPSMMRTVDNSPPPLKPLVRLTIVSECLPPTSSINPIELLGPARNELDNAPAPKKQSWYLNMVRLYAKYSPSVAPAVLTEAVAVINRTNETKRDCSPGTVSNVFSNSLIANSYRLPANLLERDDVGVRYALSSVRPADKRAMLRLQLLKDVLVQKTVTSKTVPVKKDSND